ncbi:MAG: YqgE/AlgH family protein [Fidelibacterota bacterium]
MPHLQDPYFAQSVVFLAEHKEDGAMGLIINKPFKELELKQLFTDLFNDQENLLEIVPEVFFGGPVMVERGILLHSGKYTTDGTLTVSEDFGITSHKSILEDITGDLGPEYYKLMLGHAGWGPGQLEKEIENGDWLLQEATARLIFHTPASAVWNKASQAFGIDLSSPSGIGGRA